MKNIIDPKNPSTVGSSIANLGNHVLIVLVILILVFIVNSSYNGI